MFCSHLSFINLSLSLTPSLLSLSLSRWVEKISSRKSQPLIVQPCSSSNYLPSAASLSLHFTIPPSLAPSFVFPLCISLSGQGGYFFLPSSHYLPISCLLSLFLSLFASLLVWRRSTQSSPPSVFLSLFLCLSEPACSFLSDAPLLSSAALHVLALLPPSTSLSLLISCSVASRVVCSSVTRGYHLPF